MGYRVIAQNLSVHLLPKSNITTSFRRPIRQGHTMAETARIYWVDSMIIFILMIHEATFLCDHRSLVKWETT